jgi:hypothetical protein
MRLYTVSFADVAITAAQDLFGILCTANMAIKIHCIELGQRTLATWEAKNVKLVRNPATATVGSGGAAEQWGRCQRLLSVQAAVHTLPQSRVYPSGA